MRSAGRPACSGRRARRSLCIALALTFVVGPARLDASASTATGCPCLLPASDAAASRQALPSFSGKAPVLRLEAERWIHKRLQRGNANEYTFVGNGPTTLTDPSGEVAPLVAIAILAGAGGAIFGAQEAVVQGVAGTEWDPSAIGKSAAIGAATSPLSLVGGPVGGSVPRIIVGQLGREAFGQALGLGLEYAADRYYDEGELGDGRYGFEADDEFDNCFLAGTNAETTNRGDVNIEDVRLGDRFAPPPGHACDDPRCGEVVRLFRNTTDRVVTVTAVARPRAREHRAGARDGGEAGEEDGEPPSASQTIHCTPGHPFFVQGRGWIFAGDLRVGDELEAGGEHVVVAAVEVRAERAETFNFEVRCHHTYRVSGQAGQPAVLVHNTSKAILKSIRRHSERLVRGKAAAGSIRTQQRVGQIRHALANEQFGQAGTHFHSLNARFARMAQARGHLQDVVVNKRFYTAGKYYRIPDYRMTNSHLIYDIKPWRSSPTAFHGTEQFQDLIAAGRGPVPLYYRLW